MHIHRSKSKDRANHAPGPSYMSSEQMAEYLKDLRNNRVPRPNGSRPLPASSSVPTLRTRSKVDSVLDTTTGSQLPHSDSKPPSPTEQVVRSSSALSHRRTHSSRSNSSSLSGNAGRPLVQDPIARRDFSTSPTESGSRTPSIMYRESGQRWMEKQEAASIRRAMEEMDLQEESKLFNAARDEAAELVWKHQNPNAPYNNPDAPYRYKGYLEKGAHSRSQSWSRDPQEPQRSVSRTRQRYSYSGVPASDSSGSLRGSREPSDSSMKSSDGADDKAGENRGRTSQRVSEGPAKTDKTSVTFALSDPKHRRRSSGSKRTVSGSLFRNPDDQIYEEPEEDSTISKPSVTPMPASVPLQPRRNPFSRVQSARQNLDRSNTDPTLGTKKFDRFEIHRNPPSQSRDPAYTSNTLPATPPKPTDENTEVEEGVKMKDGKEIRGDDIRAATSMRLKDRSPRLPTPTMVSDSPGRPIVSFQSCWKPKEIELKEEVSRSLPPTPGSGISPRTTVSPYSSNKQTSTSSPPPINVQEPPRVKVPEPSSVSLPSITVSGSSNRPLVPAINVQGAPAPPSITVQEAPSIAVSHPIPTINAPSISVNEAPIPTINAPSSNSQSSRPLPSPKSSSAKPFARPGSNTSAISKPHWTPSIRRNVALCDQCALPIAGRTVSAAGARFHPECFVCHHCGEGLECVAFYPEPENKRAERLDRIWRRRNGEDIKVSEGISEADDGDEGMRFYCHLDYHEFFSPRCKSCKTPIEGEVIVACGAEWHVGHFFCAQCGDPFDSSTPFVEKDGYAWCVNCHTNRYSTKCKKCRKPVVDTVVKALGAEWHAQCFCCTECGGQFDDGRYFLRGDSEDPVCVGCEERRLKA